MLTVHAGRQPRALLLRLHCREVFEVERYMYDTLSSSFNPQYDTDSHR